MILPSLITALENQLDGVNSALPESHFASELMFAIRSGELSAALDFASGTFAKASSDNERAFVLFCATSICEMLSDLATRAQWMQRWREIRSPESNAYCKYVLHFQSGLTA